MRYYLGIGAYLVLSAIFVTVVFQSFGWVLAIVATLMLLVVLYLMVTII